MTLAQDSTSQEREALGWSQQSTGGANRPVGAGPEGARTKELDGELNKGWGQREPMGAWDEGEAGSGPQWLEKGGAGGRGSGPGALLPPRSSGLGGSGRPGGAPRRTVSSPTGTTGHWCLAQATAGRPQARLSAAGRGHWAWEGRGERLRAGPLVRTQPQLA